jgi:hypothetical protein
VRAINAIQVCAMLIDLLVGCTLLISSLWFAGTAGVFGQTVAGAAAVVGAISGFDPRNWRRKLVQSTIALLGVCYTLSLVQGTAKFDDWSLLLLPAALVLASICIAALPFPFGKRQDTPD